MMNCCVNSCSSFWTCCAKNCSLPIVLGTIICTIILIVYLCTKTIDIVVLICVILGIVFCMTGYCLCNRKKSIPSNEVDAGNNQSAVRGNTYGTDPTVEEARLLRAGNV